LRLAPLASAEKSNGELVNQTLFLSWMPFNLNFFTLG
jgi:hypothetical protein